MAPFESTAARKRPKTFDELVGQEFVSSTLKSSLEEGRIFHAYLFSGPRGCGKTSAARILARSVNCEKGPTVTPCGTCASCREISRGSSLDVIEIDGASNTGVDSIRQIKDEVLFPPNNGKYKVYIIDEVHMLSNSAFNALLKTIEEPPPYIIFIFATTEIHKVPLTIKSRCQQYAFRSISVETIFRVLKETCAELQIEAEDEALYWIARGATGSLRDAYSVFDQVVSFSGGKISFAGIKDKYGLLGLEELNALAGACALNDSGGAFDAVDRVLASGVAIEQFVIDLAGFYRSLMLIRAGITKEALLGYAAERFSPEAREKLSIQQLEQAVSLLLGLYRDLRYSLSPRFELELAVSKLCWLDKWISPADLRGAVESVRGAFGGTLPPGGALPAGGSPSSAGFLDRPGAFTEGLKQIIAQKAAEKPAAIPEDAENVRRLFRGTVVN